MEPFYWTDLPLPLSRKLKVAEIAPPAEVRAAREWLAAALRPVIFHLDRAERERLDTPVVDSWYRGLRYQKLAAYYPLLRDEGLRGALSISPEEMDAVSTLSDAACYLRYANEDAESTAGDGRLVMDLLLTRGVQRIGEAVAAGPDQKRARSADRAALARRWEAVCQPAPWPPVPGPGGPAERPDRPPRDLVALVLDLCPGALKQTYREAFDRIAALHVPRLTPWSHLDAEKRERQEAERREIVNAVDPAAAARAAACLRELYPAAPWLAGRSGVRPEELAHLLSWREEFAELAAQALEREEDLEDTERMVWTHARHLLRTLYSEVADHIVTHKGEFGGALFSLRMAVERGRQPPPPDETWEQVRIYRRQFEQTWRERLFG